MINSKIQKFKNYIEGKIILITGGTGSFGHMATDALLTLNPKQIIIFDRDEKAQFDMSNQYCNDKLKFIMGDVKDRQTIDPVMKGTDLVFHAAAIKQVPSCEFFPIESIKINSIGSYNVIQSAIDNNVERVVVLSTDKAVYPINVMGMTKALMERIMISFANENKGRTMLCATRYGNVMYTRGSVIPYFVDLMKAKKPLTVTNKNMTRFMMSLEDSIDLVLYALSNGKNGEIYVRKSPAATIDNLVQAMISLFSYKGGIKEIGNRPGEKMHETLISTEEMGRAEDLGDYYKIVPEFYRIDLKQYYYQGAKKNYSEIDNYTSENTKRLSLEETKKILFSLKEVRQDLDLFKKEYDK